MEKPIIGRLDLSTKDLQMIKWGTIQITFGGNKGDILAKLFELQFNGHLLGLIGEAESAIVLNWIGSKIPRGVVINNKEIAGAQNKVVTSKKGEIIGIYDRLIESGGENNDEHCMVVFLFGNQSSSKE
ncbi:hypothetical protein A2954_07135 [Candidatus Roizmanbacteria bacterium RIFCSPLOWO2_01_FULL_37_12]|uniref:Uncharacterized protein n=1 Tax=Candidatus Roizmanbacteria bacterium RIFCSPLOWO2_01_FULL_37_12 TaxID=1802056 RepID=A0A1F7IE46_9BACT|nr:MAG: hypothetical protein A2954_07135 [Candidatus Roizmanbacteria bacterium RIFCSPLOWO2_01_FULL_37_12]